jgi:RTX calcium-binding nonapeptide repeat (4 copies)/PASTA domain
VSKRGVFAGAVLVFALAAAAASAAVTAEYFDGELLVGSDAADPISVTCAGGRAKVNGADPEGDPAPCGQVVFIEVYGGPGPNAINLAGVNAAAFTSVEEVIVGGDEGNDTIAGSQLPDGLDGDLGDDTLRGNTGSDELSGGSGDDRVFGGAGDDTLYAVVGNDSLDGQAGSDTYRLDLFQLGPGGRVADTGSEGTDVVDVGDCEGVTVEAGQITREGARVEVSGIETYPCGYVPPPAPPAPPAPPPPPSATKPACVVPRLRGRSLAKAKVLLVRAHCSLGKVTRVRSRVKRGTVLKQSPAPGLRRARGTKVSLRVSRGP